MWGSEGDMEQAGPKGEVGGLLTVIGRNLWVSAGEGWGHSCLCFLGKGCPGVRCLALLTFVFSWQLLGERR